jgi:cullin-associated NEDD8-dissociated protein 1
VTLNFPSWHPKERWDEEKWMYSPIGVWADVVDFSTLPSKVQGAGVAGWVGASAVGWSNDGFEVCGSPGEVANEPTSGHQYRGYIVGDQGDVSERTLDQDHPPWFSKAMVWSTVAMNGADQLRQRVA